MSKYTVEILQIRPRLGLWPPFKLRVYAPPYDNIFFTGYAYTMRGAKRLAMKRILGHRDKHFKPKMLKTYEVQV